MSIFSSKSSRGTVYTLLMLFNSARNVPVPAKSQVHEPNYGQHSEKMGSIPLTHSLLDSKPLVHDFNLAQVSCPLFLQLSRLRRFEVFISHSLNSAELSHCQSIRMFYNSSRSILRTRVASTAACNSRLEILTNFTGALLAFPITKIQWT